MHVTAHRSLQIPHDRDMHKDKNGFALMRRQATLPIIYQHFILKKLGHSSQAYQALLRRFRNKSDHEVARHVRRLRIKDDIPEEYFLLVIDRISASGRLKELRLGPPTIL